VGNFGSRRVGSELLNAAHQNRCVPSWIRSSSLCFAWVVFLRHAHHQAQGLAATIASLGRGARRPVALEHGLIRPRAWATPTTRGLAPLPGFPVPCFPFPRAASKGLELGGRGCISCSMAEQGAPAESAQGGALKSQSNRKAWSGGRGGLASAAALGLANQPSFPNQAFASEKALDLGRAIQRECRQPQRNPEGGNPPGFPEVWLHTSSLGLNHTFWIRCGCRLSLDRRPSPRAFSEGRSLVSENEGWFAPKAAAERQARHGRPAPMPSGGMAT